jgi:hypothetical protein
MPKRETENKIGITGSETCHPRGRKKLRRRNCGKTEIDGEAWLLDDPYKVEMS